MIRYFSVDEEFSGLNHRKNCLLSIGMVEIEVENNKYFPNYSREFYIELKPTGKIEKQAMAINKLDIENLQNYGFNKESAVKETIKYLNLKSDDIAIFIAYCGILDKIYFDQLFDDVKEMNPFHYEIIELSSLAIGKLNLKWGFTESELLDKLKLNDLNKEEKHNALNDAILQAKIFCNLMNLH